MIEIPTLRSGIIPKDLPVCDRPTLGLLLRWIIYDRSTTLDHL